jgi:hypothetical protein
MCQASKGVACWHIGWVFDHFPLVENESGAIAHDVEMLGVLFSPCPEELDFFFDERFLLQFGSCGGCVAQI